MSDAKVWLVFRKKGDTNGTPFLIRECCADLSDVDFTIDVDAEIPAGSITLRARTPACSLRELVAAVEMVVRKLEVARAAVGKAAQP